MSLEWNNEQTRILIDERKMDNEERLKPTMKELKIRGVLLGNIITRNSPQNSGKNPVINFVLWYILQLDIIISKEEIEGYLLFLGIQRPLSNTTVSTTSSSTPLTVVSDRQSSSESLNSFKTGSDTSSSPHKQTKSSRPVTPSTEIPVVSRPVTPTLSSFSQSANVINVTINYGSKGSSSEEQ
ncbi:unnamed protein product [Rhizophagus irregularis]|nr:unnamed protein product [Rhizophagus irregularis]